MNDQKSKIIKFIPPTKAKENEFTPGEWFVPEEEKGSVDSFTRKIQEFMDSTGNAKANDASRPTKETDMDKKDSPKRAFDTTAELEEAVGKIIPVMEKMESGNSIKLGHIRSVCGCSENPARKVYNRALREVGKLIFLDDTESASARIAEPKATKRGVNIPMAFIDHLFTGFSGKHPYQSGTVPTCTRNGEDLIISPKK